MAFSNWNGRFVYNPNEEVTGRSNYEIRDRFAASASYRFNFFENAPTTVSMYYEGRSGDPFSWVYAQDLNGDGQTTNDLVAVPSGPNDPRFDFSTMNAATQALYFQALQTTGLNAYAGGVAPKNAFFTPFEGEFWA